MAESTDVTPHASPSAHGASDRPIVYLVNAEDDGGRSVNLPTLLAPIWRWRWVSVLIMLLAIAAAGWKVLVPGSLQQQLVIRPGVLTQSYVLAQLEHSIIPIAKASVAPWRPEIEVEVDDLSLDSEDANAASSLANLRDILVSFRFDHAKAADQLTQAIEEGLAGLKSISEAMSSVKREQVRLRLRDNLRIAQDGLQQVTSPDYVAALRGQSEAAIATSQAAIDREDATLDSLMARRSAIESRAPVLQNLLQELTQSMSPEESSDPAMAQILADRVASLRLELETAIPRERLELIQSQKQAQADKDKWFATLSAQRLKAATFESDLLAQQAEATQAVTAAESALSEYETRIQAQLADSPLTIVGEYQDRGDGLPMIAWAAVLLIAGVICSLCATLGLEALRLARMGVEQG
ncbi:MAG: gp58-like family protein [Phycisphaerales bacterium]|nr:gp58-like family protein [Phycisphaerales bacterium]